MTEYDKSVVNALPFIVQDFFWLENQSLTDKILHDEPMGDFERLTLPTFDLYERTVASFGAVSNRSPDVLNYEALLTLLYIGYINEKIPKKISEDYNPDSIFVLSYDEENAVDLTKVVYKNQEEKEALEEEAEENEDEESDKEDDAKAAEEMGSFIVNDEGSSSESAGSGSSSESNSEGSESEFETSTENEQEEEVVEQEEEVVEPNIKPSGHLVYYVKGEGFAPEDVYFKKAYIMIYVWLFAKTKFNELTTLLQQVEDYESSDEGSEEERSDEEEGASGDVSSGSVSSDSDEEFKSEVRVAVGKSKRELPKRQRKERYTREKIQQFAAETEQVNKDVRRELKGKPSKKDAAKNAEIEAKKAEANAIREAKRAEANAVKEAKRAQVEAKREAKKRELEEQRLQALQVANTSQQQIKEIYKQAQENAILSTRVENIKIVLENINYLLNVLTNTKNLTATQIKRSETNAKTYLVQAKNYLKPPEEKTKKPKQRKK